jgi:uncharacterized protein YfeS
MTALKNRFIVSIVVGFLSLPALGQGGGNDVFSPATANPKAKALMKEDFFWSPIDESGPFGSDDGSDAAHGYYEWRRTNRAGSPVAYLTDLSQRWGYPPIEWDELDTNRLKAYMALGYHPNEKDIQQMVQMLKQENEKDKTPNKKTLTDEQLRQVVMQSGQGMGVQYLVGLDQSIIGVAFAQIVLEGKIEPKLRYYVTKALQREMLMVVTRHFGDASQQKAHNDKMRKMLYVVEQFK